ncbi:MAG TPA: hypothetical protein VK497_02240 [Candidatus Saccharimonadales bacterium]|nr:hypothetical protein [Candidatus Saccharimonadales bacterium]
MSGFLTKKMVGQAIDMAMPSIDFVLRTVAKRHAGHLRVSTVVNGGWETIATRDFGDRSTWQHEYEEHATGKEEISQRTGKSSRAVQSMYPELLEHDDTVYYGSVISPGGTIVVAFSGVEALEAQRAAGQSFFFREID